MDHRRLRLLAPLRRLWGPNFLLPALLVAALALRLYGIDWDHGHGFHPDERSFYLRADDMFRVLTGAPGHETWTAEWPEMRLGLPDIQTALSAERQPAQPTLVPPGQRPDLRPRADPVGGRGVHRLGRHGHAVRRPDAGGPGGHGVGGRDVCHRTPDVRHVDGPVGGGSHSLCGHTHPARPFLPARALHRAHVAGGPVGHAAVHRHSTHPRCCPAGLTGGPGHGAQGVGRAHPGAFGAGVPLGVERPVRRTVDRPDGVVGGEVRSDGRAGGVAGPGGVFHHHPVRIPGSRHVRGRHPGPGGDGAGGGPLAVHVAVRRPRRPSGTRSGRPRYGASGCRWASPPGWPPRSPRGWHGAAG